MLLSIAALRCELPLMAFIEGPGKRGNRPSTHQYPGFRHVQVL